MPREASKCRGWEKERRNRLKEGFGLLAKVLPCYDPSVNLSKIEILNKATCVIEELQEEVNKIVSTNAETDSAKDNIVKKLQQRIKKLVIRNGQLNNLLKDAGISVPKVVGNVKHFKGKLPWSKRISPGQAKIFQKNEMEKENMSAELAQAKKEKIKLETNEVPKRHIRIDKNLHRINLKGRKIRKATASTPGVFVLSQPSAVGSVKQQCYFIVNPSTSSTLTKSKTNGSGLQTSPIMNAIVSFINPSMPSFGPGILVLANGTVVPLLPQSHIVVPSQLSAVSKPVTSVNVNSPKQSAIHEKSNEKHGNLEIKKHLNIRPKPCVTKTTQVNKVPIPALTSRYANSNFLLSEAGEKRKCENGQNRNSHASGMRRKATKRKNDIVVDISAKKARYLSKNTIDFEIKTDVKESSENNHSTALVSEIADKSEPTIITEATTTITATTSTTAILISESTIPESNALISLSEASKSVDVSESHSTKLLAPVLLISGVQSSGITQSTKHNIVIDQKVDNESVENNTNETSQDSGDVCNKNSSGKSSSTCTQSSDTCTRSNVNQSVTADVHEDTIKQLELNLVHSELSNDIFASLQVPPGCQNPESTSPTAAFLLAFPLVSSVKVAEVIDEDNSESQREIPTLLQIGTMDSTKSKHTDTLASGLLGLDGFSFFNKDVCGNYYNSYPKVAKKGNESADEKAVSMSKSTVDTKSSSLRICEQFTADETAQALPGTRSMELTYSSKIGPGCVKQSKVIENDKQNDEFRRTESLAVDPVKNSVTKNPDAECLGVQESSKQLGNIRHNKYFDDPKEYTQKDESIGEKQHSKVVEINTLSKEKHENKLSSDNICSEQIIIRKNKENHNSEMFCKNTDKTVNTEMCENTENARISRSMNVFEENIKEVCNSISLNPMNKTSRCMTQERKNIISKERTENFIGTHKNVHNLESHDICYKTVPKENISNSIGKNSAINRENITKNMLNEIPYIYSKPDLSKKVVADININNFENIHNNSKDNKNINFNAANINRENVSAPLIYKENSVRYNSFHAKPPNSLNSTRNCDGSFDSRKPSENVNFNLFGAAHANVIEQIPTSLSNSLDKIANPSIDSNVNSKTTAEHVQHNKKSDDTCLRGSGQKQQCYFSASYPDASCSFNYTTNPSKICPTCSYMNLNKNCPNPLYTNCNNYNYNYPETNFNQNYYKNAISKTETKSYYTLNYENYQEHRKIDTSTFTPKCYGNANYMKGGKTTTDKEKCLAQNKPVNWMTTPDNRVQPPEPFLPAFANQSYSFASCNTGEVSDANNTIELKKTDLIPLVPDDKQFSWSPTKLPNYLDTTANFVTPTLPTLVGDLALGNPLTFGDQKPECKYPKEPKRKNTAYENQGNFLSVSQLVDHSKPENVPARIAARRNSGNRAKNILPVKIKKSPKNDHDKGSHVEPTPNNYGMLGTSDIFCEPKNRNSTKGMSSSYSAEALIGNQGSEIPKKYPSNSIKPAGSSNFLTENIINYFPAVDDNYMTQNQNNMLHSFQNNTYNTNTFVYTTPTISSSHVTSNFEAVGNEYPQGNFAAVPNTAVKENKTCPSRNYRPSNKYDKNLNYSSNVKKSRKKQTYESTTSGFDYPLLSMPGSTNSPILPDDFHSHANFLPPPTTPYSSKNTFYQRQGNEFNTNALLPLTGLHLNNIQHPETSPSMNAAGTSLTNFNLSTIFPEINKGAISNMYPDNRNKQHSTSQQVPYNIDSKYTFPG